jgi:HD-GYP domain-containing protein (c-di-GMP phosphodiesterase class II)
MMTEQKPSEGSLTEEFRRLGKNLAQILQATWEHPERKRFQQEVESGITQIRKTMEQEIESFRESPTAQRLKSDTEDVRKRFESGELQAKIREEILTALRAANEELQKTTAQWSSETKVGEETEPPRRPSETAGLAQHPEGHTEVHPDDVASTADQMGHMEVHPDDVESTSDPSKD